MPNASLIAGLEARGARVADVSRSINGTCPRIVGPLEANMRAIAAGEIDVVMFTSSQQVVNLLRVAERTEALGTQLRAGHGQRRGRLDRPDDQRDARASWNLPSTSSRSIRRWGSWSTAAAEQGGEAAARAKRTAAIIAAVRDSAADSQSIPLAGPGTTARS